MTTRGFVGLLRRSSTQHSGPNETCDDPQSELTRTISSSASMRGSRKSSIASLKLSFPLRNSKRKAAEANKSDASSTPSQLGFLTLPSELQIAIIDHCVWADICALRGSCKALNTLITDPGSAIARHWFSFKLDPLSRLLYPVPQEGDHWKHLLGQTRKWSVAQNLASILTNYVQYKTLLYSNAQRQLRFKPVALRLRRKMTPLLFIVGHYLLSCQRIVLEGCSVSNEGASFENDFLERSRDICAALTRQQLLAGHDMWLFLQWIFNQIMNRPSYAGSLERAVRGWTAEPLDSPTLTTMLVHTNLSGMIQLLGLKDYNERRKHVNAHLKSLHPGTNPKWAEKWSAMESGTGRPPTQEQVVFALVPQLSLDTLWITGKQSIDNETEMNESEPLGSASRTVKFLGGLAGYDLFHQAPPPAHLLEEDEEEENVLESAEAERVSQHSQQDSPQVEEELEDRAWPEIQQAAQGQLNEGSNYWDI